MHNNVTRPIDFGSSTHVQARCSCGWISRTSFTVPRGDSPATAIAKADAQFSTHADDAPASSQAGVQAWIGSR